MMNGVTLQEYADHHGIRYLSAWRRLKAGKLPFKQLEGGAIVIPRRALNLKCPPQNQDNSEWTIAEVRSEVYKLCQGRYVQANKFPAYLYKLCNKLFGSVRAAKWDAKIIHGRHWTKGKFLKCVRQYCVKLMDDQWPENMKLLAIQFCGSIRKAKLDSKIILDERSHAPGGIERRGVPAIPKDATDDRVLKEVYDLCKGTYIHSYEFPQNLRKLCIKHFSSVRDAKWSAKIRYGHWEPSKFLKCVRQFCIKHYRSEKDWPPKMRHLAVHFCGSIRKAKMAAQIVHDMRGKIPQSGDRRGKIALHRKKILDEIRNVHQNGQSQKVKYWPGFLRQRAQKYFGSTRLAQIEAGVIDDSRKVRRS